MIRKALRGCESRADGNSEGDRLSFFVCFSLKVAGLVGASTCRVCTTCAQQWQPQPEGIYGKKPME